jgi:chromosome segregation ATPase
MGLKELIEAIQTNAKACIITAGVLIPLTVTILEYVRVSPLTQRVAELTQKAAELKEQVTKLEADNEPNRKRIEQLLADNQKLENALGASQKNVKTLETYSSKVEQNLNICKANGSILKKIRELEAEKASIQKKIDSRWLIVPEDISIARPPFDPNPPPPQPRVVSSFEEKWQRRSDEVHTRIVGLEKLLQCEPR